LSRNSSFAGLEARMRQILVGCVISVASLLSAEPHPVQAKDYPDKPVRIVVPYSPGGAVDIVARVFAQKLSEGLDGRFYVENLAGAGGDIGTVKAAAAPADGSTILFTAPDFLTSPLIKAKAPFDPIGSFAPVTLLATSPGLISVNPALPVTSMNELLALLKANPGKYTYASPGHGTKPHLEGVRLFKVSHGLDVVHVPFPGQGPALTSTVAGHTAIAFGTLPIISPYAKEGTLRALAISSAKRSPELPDVPTKEEAGVPEYGGGFWSGVLVPAGTPKHIVARLHEEIVRIMQQPDVQERLHALGYEPVGSPPDEFAGWLKTEYAKWREVVRAANLKAN
jgi:tripartite-type tricarboxylate transporter receptor subunit TctC